MLKDLLSSVPAGNPRFLGAYNRLLDTITTRMDVAKGKFKFVQLPRTQGIETLEWMIYNLNLTDAKSYTDDFELYAELLEDKAFKYRVAFDPVAVKTLGRNKFFHSKVNKHPTEVFFNASRESPVTQLPFGQSYYNGWHKVRAIRILTYDTNEIPLDLNFGYPTFVNKEPTYATIAIDIPVLLMKWIKWRKAWARGITEQNTALRFLKEEEFVHFFDDFVNIWVTRMINKVLFHKNATAAQIVSELDMPRFIADKAVVEIGVKAVQEVLNLIDNRALKFQDFLACKFYPGGLSIRDKINQLDSEIILPDSLQYLWLNVLKSLPFFQMISTVIDRDPENPAYQQVMRKAYWVWMRKIRTTKLPNYQFAGPVREYVELAQSLFAAIFAEKLDVGSDPTAQAE